MDDCVQLGFIKVKFPLAEHASLQESHFMPFCRQFASTRVTGHFVYVAMGHNDIPDNHVGRELLREIGGLGGKITRLDFAIDVRQAFDIAAYYNTMRALYEGKFAHRRVGTPCLLTSPAGTTCYVGKRSSSRMLRVYDKRAEILHRKKVDIEFDLTRFEIEIKRGQITRYKRLFMSGATQAIVDDIAERYSLHWLSASPNKVKPFHIPQKHDGELAFVYRYRSIIAKAWAIDKAEFLDMIGNPL